MKFTLGANTLVQRSFTVAEAGQKKIRRRIRSATLRYIFASDAHQGAFIDG
jgi:hypothetical protein